MSTSDRRAQLATRLRERVLAQLSLGVLQPGQQLPGARELAKEYQADPRAVIEAFRELERESIVQLRSRSGVYVAPADGTAQDRQAAWLAEVLLDGLKLGVSAAELGALVARATESRRVRAAIIDCNEDELWSSQQELQRDYGIEASAFLLTDVSANGRFPAALRDANLVVTTEVHAEAVGRIASLVGATFIPLRTQSELFAEVRRMVVHTDVHFVVADGRYAQKVHHLLLQGDSDEHLKLHVIGRDDLAGIPANAPLYVTPRAQSLLRDNGDFRSRLNAGRTAKRAFSADTSVALLRVLTQANLAVDF